MSVQQGKKYAFWVPLLVGLFPIVSLIFCIAISAPPADSAAPAPGAPPKFILFILLVVVTAKILAFVGSFRGWYYAWIYYYFELSIVVFAYGLFLVVAVFSLPYSLAGFIKLIVFFLGLFATYALRHYWLGREARERYSVGYYTHL